MSTNKTFSIAELNATTVADIPRDLPLINKATGEEIGITLKVVSEESAIFKAFQRKALNTERMKLALQSKTGKTEVETWEETEQKYDRAVAARIVGWEGITEEYSPALALQLVSNNASIAEQVLKCSSEPVDFTANK